MCRQIDFSVGESACRRNDFGVGESACRRNDFQAKRPVSTPRSQETSNDSRDDDAAYTDKPLADAEWIEKYQEEMKANEELERSLKDWLQGNVELKEW